MGLAEAIPAPGLECPAPLSEVCTPEESWHFFHRSCLPPQAPTGWRLSLLGEGLGSHEVRRRQQAEGGLAQLQSGHVGKQGRELWEGASYILLDGHLQNPINP